MKTVGKTLAIVAAVIVGLIAVAALVLVRPDIPMDQLQAKYRAPTDSYMQMPDGVMLHYRDEGPRGGYTIVLVHGFSASLIDWDAWAAALSTRYRVIRIDLPGHGLTSAPADYKADTDRYADVVDGFLTRMMAPRVILVGNSMGGAVAWNYAERHAGRLDGLVLVDAAGWPHKTAPGGGPIIFKLMRNPLVRPILPLIDTRPLIGQGLRSAFIDSRLVTPELIGRYADFARAPGHRSILLSLQGGERSAAAIASLSGISVPTLVMHGQDDHLVPFADGQAFARAIPGATLIAYPGVGHVPMEQIPARSANDLDAWIRSKVYPAPPGALDPGPVAAEK